MRSWLIATAMVVALPVFAITLLWDTVPENELYTVHWTNNVTAPLPWPILSTTITNTFQTNLTPQKAFFYVTASNFWGESVPSNIINTPCVTTNPSNVLIRRVP